MAAKLVICCGCRSFAAAIIHWLVYHSYVAHMLSTVSTGVPPRLEGPRVDAGSSSNAGTCKEVRAVRAAAVAAGGGASGQTSRGGSFRIMSVHIPTFPQPALSVNNNPTS